MEEIYKTKVNKLFEPERIKCLILFHSQILGQITSDECNKLILILDEYKPSDQHKLHDLYSDLGSSIDLILQYLQDINLKGWKNNYFGGSELFWLDLYRSSPTLLGINIIKQEMRKISQEDVKKSVLMYIDSLFGLLNKTSISHRSKSENILKILLYLLFLNKDICILSSSISTKNELITISLNKKYFSDYTKIRLKDIFLEEIDHPMLFEELKRFLYLDYLNFYKQKQFI